MNQKHRKAYRALMKVARNEGISLQRVIREIELSIQDAYEQAQAQNNQDVLEKWSKIPCRGKLPSAVELVGFLEGKLEQDICMGDLPDSDEPVS